MQSPVNRDVSHQVLHYNAVLMIIAVASVVLLPRQLSWADCQQPPCVCDPCSSGCCVGGTCCDGDCCPSGRECCGTVCCSPGWQCCGGTCRPPIDCNSNGIADDCDLLSQESVDLNTNGIPDECDPVVDRIDINQSLQNTNGTLTLVAEKLTMVRALVDWNKFKGANPTQMPIFGKLYVDIDGQPHPNSPFMNVSSAMAAWVPRSDPDPANEDDSLNFVIDDIPESSDVDLRVELLPDPRLHPFGDPFGALSKNDVTFECRRVPSVAYVRIDYRFTASGSGPNLVANATVQNADLMVESAYPIPELEYFDVGTIRHNGNVNSVLNRLVLLIKLGIHNAFSVRPTHQNDFLFGWLPDFPGNGNFAGGLGLGRNGFGGPASAGHAQYLLAHELGHMFGQCHVGGTAGFDSCCLIPGHLPQPSLTLKGLGVDVPNNLTLAGPRIKAPTDFCSASNTTPVGCLQQGACGCTLSASPSIHGFCSIMMGDCNCFLELQWIDVDFYQHILDSPITTCPSGSRSITPRSSTPVWLVSGSYDGTSDVGTIGTIIEAPSSTPLTSTNTNGALNLKAYHTTGGSTLLYDLQFDPGVLFDSGDTEDTQPFVVFVSSEGGNPSQAVEQLKLVFNSNGAVLDTRDITSNAPQVSFTAPSPTDVITNGAVITWTGSDADSDGLRYTLTYSWDAGTSSLPLVVDSTTTSFTLHTDFVPGSQSGEAEFAIRATDGMNTTIATVSNVTVDALKGPTIAIHSPVHGSSHMEESALVLAANVFDPEDGTVPDNEIRWRSSLDGQLGTGVSIMVSTLGVGTHKLTVSATDSDSMVTSNSVTVFIRDRFSTVDCNSNGVADDFDISYGTSTDCQTNFVPDDCDIAGATSIDCDSNGLPDECEPDCNTNGNPDACDIAAGTSNDQNTNGVPDECEAPFVTYIRVMRTHGLVGDLYIEAPMTGDANTDPRLTNASDPFSIEVGFSKPIDADAWDDLITAGQHPLFMWHCAIQDQVYWPEDDSTEAVLDTSGLFATFSNFWLVGNPAFGRPPNDAQYLITAHADIADLDGAKLQEDRNAKIIFYTGDVNGDGAQDDADRVAVCQQFCSPPTNCDSVGVCSSGGFVTTTQALAQYDVSLIKVRLMFQGGKINSVDVDAVDAGTNGIQSCE